MHQAGKWASLAAAAMAFGAAAAQGDVDYRQNAMKAVGGHMGAIADIVRGKVPHAAHLQSHANAMADLAAIAPALFPQGSEGGDALSAIWTDSEDFQAKLTAFREAADALKAAAGSGEMPAIGAGVRRLGQSCKSCHDSYRAE